MKIKLYKKAPKCPKCKVPMSDENKAAYTDEQQKMIDCEPHDWIILDEAKEKHKISHFKCSKCGDTLAKQRLTGFNEDGTEKPIEYETLGHMILPTAKLYRCPKCLDLYKVEENAGNKM